MTDQHPTTLSLSSTAQAVFYAFNSKFDWIEDGVPGPQFSAIAAALRAAADLVVPYEPEPKWFEPLRPHFNRQRIRRRFLAIATELESAND